MEADMGLGASSGTISTDQCQVIEVHVAESRDLFHAIDPSPFKQRDLDPVAEDFIVGWARESRQDVPFATAACWQPEVGLQVSVVHALLSPQVRLLPAAHTPD